MSPHSSAWAVLNRLALGYSAPSSVSVEKSCLDMQLGQIRPIKLTETRLPGRRTRKRKRKSFFAPIKRHSCVPFTP